jgi:DNA-binding NarL/FixJ family response regulator
MHYLALVDDHILIRQGLASLINASGNYTVLFEADNGKDFINKLKPNALPDLVLMDITMPEMNGYETTSWLRINYPSVKVLALSVMDDESSVIRILKSGAKGYIVKNAKPTELLDAMNSILTKGYFFNEIVSSKLISSINKNDEIHNDAKNLITLTERETEFLKLVCSELSYKAIAEKMFVGHRTIDTYRDNLFVKLNIKSRVGLVMFAIRNGIVHV